MHSRVFYYFVTNENNKPEFVCQDNPSGGYIYYSDYPSEAKWFASENRAKEFMISWTGRSDIKVNNWQLRTLNLD